MKNHFFLPLFVLPLITSAQIPGDVPQDQILFWAEFDGDLVETFGQLQATDVEFAADRFAVPGAAADFNGASSVVQVPVIESTVFSLSFWMKPSCEQTWKSKIFYNSDSESWNWRIAYEDGIGESDWLDGPGIEFGAVDTQGNRYGVGLPFPSCETWSHIVCISHGDEIEWHLNGEFVGSVAMPYPMRDIGDGDLLIGSRFLTPGPESFYKGVLDEIGVWEKVLTSQEIEGLYVRGQVEGCTDELACNFNPEANVDDSSCIPSGCMDSQACNFNLEAECEGQSCDYSCCPGPGCCTEGMYWDWELSRCYNINPADINLDGCVQLGDLLDLLSAYGNCGAEEMPWQCGDPLEYQGYDYETVQIGEQCWFAENLRSENYENGDAIPAGLSNADWSSTTLGATAVYGEDALCNNYSPDIDACDPAQSLNEYGRLYNWYAVDDARGLCPSGWHVPTDENWMTMEMALGMAQSEVGNTGWRGTDQGTQMRTTYGWNDGGNGTNSSGLSGLPGGNRRSSNGGFYYAGDSGNWWSSSPTGPNAWYRGLDNDFESVSRDNNNQRYGFSVRCIKDTD